MEIKVLHLYYDLLNLYGEYGNINILASRLEDQGINVIIDKKTIGDSFDISQYDFIYCGSGTELNIELATKDLITHKQELLNYIDANKYALFTGNSMEMLGKRLYKLSGESQEDLVTTLELFPFECERLKERKTGDIIFSSKIFEKDIVGFINKQSDLYNNGNPLFEVKMGVSDNKDVKTEGTFNKNFYVTSVIGPLLVRNPEVLNYFVNGIIKVKDDSFKTRNIEYKNEDEGYNLVLKELSAQIN